MAMLISNLRNGLKGRVFKIVEELNNTKYLLQDAFTDSSIYKGLE